MNIFPYAYKSYLWTGIRKDLKRPRSSALIKIPRHPSGFSLLKREVVIGTVNLNLISYYIVETSNSSNNIISLNY